ncbi:MAG: TonB-dependent receptor [Proteobacteria bacterium]|nr:TonB-dependent receptor [Pseudomonadota bacterium]
MRILLLCTASLLASPALAQSAPPPVSDGADSDDNAAIVITARRLDVARDSIDPALGANDFKLDRAALDIQPGGADRSLKGVLLQAPGVAQDSDGDGDIHIRNEHGNIQYRLNGITVPQGYAGFGALVDPRIANSIEVITGALPAQYGFKTAGVVNMKTRTDGFDFDGDVGIYGGSNATIQPSATMRDTVGKLSFFVSGSYLRNDLGISNPTPERSAIHDRTEQARGFAYLSYLLNDSSRLTAFGGTSYGSFQIPNSPGIPVQYSLNGRTTFDSATLDQNQHQRSHFGVLAWQYSGDQIDVQIAPFVRYAKAHFTPDPQGGQLMFSGVDTDLTQSSLAWGVQSDAGIKLGDAHHLRMGAFFQNEHTRTDSLTRVFALDGAGDRISDAPLSIPLNQRQSGSTLGLYVQDEWALSDTLTFNYGLRYDRSDALIIEDQVSPRLGLVWKPNGRTTLHAGYARNFTPPPIELVASAALAAFDNTTNAASVKRADPIRSEREHSFDVGAQHFITPRLSLTLDLYYKLKRNLLDEEHFGSTLIQSPFNYEKSRGWGVELGVNYESKPGGFYLNVATGEQKAKNIVSNQFFFDQAELDYIANHYIYTDHSQRWTISGGGSLKVPNRFGEFRPSFDFIYGDGLRAGDPLGVVPNGGKQSPYLQVNLGLAQVFGENEEKGFTLRFDVTNLFDATYLIHDGSGVGAGQPEWGPRRAFFVGVRKSF